MRNFLTVPRQLEKLLLFGMLVCLDTFLYVTTFLPIRIVIGVFSTLFSLVSRWVGGVGVVHDLFIPRCVFFRQGIPVCNIDPSFFFCNS